MPPSELQKFTQFSVQILGGTSVPSLTKSSDSGQVTCVQHLVRVFLARYSIGRSNVALITFGWAQMTGGVEPTSLSMWVQSSKCLLNTFDSIGVSHSHLACDTESHNELRPISIIDLDPNFESSKGNEREGARTPSRSLFGDSRLSSL